MAGLNDSIPTKTGMPEIDVTDPFLQMNGALAEIRDLLSGRDDTEMQVDLPTTGTRQSMHVKLRTSILVFAADSAAAITLTLGSRTFVFQLPGADTRVIPFATVIDRGIDVSVAASAGNITVAYLLGNRE
jgi:hypothetical protein